MESFLSWASKKFARWWHDLVRDPFVILLETFGAMVGVMMGVMMLISAFGLFASIPFMVYFGYLDGTSPEEMYEYHKVLNDAPGAAGEAYREDLRNWMRHASLDEQVEFLRLTSEGQE